MPELRLGARTAQAPGAPRGLARRLTARPFAIESGTQRTTLAWVLNELEELLPDALRIFSSVGASTPRYSAGMASVAYGLAGLAIARRWPSTLYPTKTSFSQSRLSSHRLFGDHISTNRRNF